MRAVVKSSLVRQVHEVLREEIMRLRLRPGEKVRVDALATTLGVSRTPVRDALNLLVEEGLVELRPRVGYFVVRLTPRDVVEISEVRKIIETYALQQALPDFTDQEILAMEEELLSLMSLPPTQQAAAFERVDRQFHLLLIERSGNRHLGEVAQRIHAFVEMMRHLNVRVPQAIAEHLRIVRAMKRRDAEDASRLLAEHIDNVREVILSQMAGEASPGQSEPAPSQPEAPAAAGRPRRLVGGALR